MPIQITFELSDTDLDYFRNVMRETHGKTKLRDEKQIVAGARQMARNTRKLELPDFVVERLRELDTLTRMLEDTDWSLDGGPRKRVLTALSYFANSTDLVPDPVPGLGFLDDAIIVELVVEELRPELEAYALFCGYRVEEESRAGVDPDEKKRRLEERRRAVHARIETRREERFRRGSWRSIFQ